MPFCRHFALVDVSHGIQLYTYEGRANISPKFSGMKPEWISHHTLSFSTDMLVVRDTTDEKSRRECWSSFDVIITFCRYPFI